MVKNLRVDERLVHGQVVTNWLRTLGVKYVVVVNDVAANDPLQKKALQMAVPQDIKLLVVGVDSAIKTLVDPRAKGKEMLVVCGNLSDTLKLVRSIDDIEEINIANYGYMISTENDNRKQVSSRLRLNDEDYELIRKIAEKGVPVVHQPLPSNVKKNMSKI